jgi:hypothetical protein
MDSVSQNSYGFLWILMDPYEFLWNSMGSHMLLMDSFEFVLECLWIPTGSSQLIVESVVFSRIAEHFVSNTPGTILNAACLATGPEQIIECAGSYASRPQGKSIHEDRCCDA